MSLNAQLYILPEKLEALVQASLADWKQNNKVKSQGGRGAAAARSTLTSGKT